MDEWTDDGGWLAGVAMTHLTSDHQLAFCMHPHDRVALFSERYLQSSHHFTPIGGNFYPARVPRCTSPPIPWSAQPIQRARTLVPTARTGRPVDTPWAGRDSVATRWSCHDGLCESEERGMMPRCTRHDPELESIELRIRRSSYLAARPAAEAIQVGRRRASQASVHGHAPRATRAGRQ